MPAATKKTRAKPGAKPQGPYEGKSKTITTRITPLTRRRLEEAAESAGRSLSQEIEFRLERSFDREDGIGGPRTAAVLRRLGHLAEASQSERHWLDDDATFNAVVDWWNRTLRDMAPPVSAPIERRIQSARKWLQRLRDGIEHPQIREKTIELLGAFYRDTTLPADVREEIFRGAMDVIEHPGGRGE